MEHENNFELYRSMGNDVLLQPEASDVIYSIEGRDIAEMIDLSFFMGENQFTEDDLVDALRLWDEGKESVGAKSISRERKRQINKENWTSEHDDQQTDEQLAMAAVFYATPEKYGEMLAFWPWDNPHKKQTHSRIRQLVIAGALIAAEIDRLLRLESPKEEVKDNAII